MVHTCKLSTNVQQLFFPQRLVIGMGYPRVFLGYPYPYLRKPIPTTWVQVYLGVLAWVIGGLTSRSHFCIDIHNTFTLHT